MTTTTTDLKASEKRYRRLFEAARDGILILDPTTGQVVDVNPFLTELTGYSRKEFLGKHVWELGPANDTVASKKAFDELRAKRFVRYEDLPLQAADGHEIAVEFVSNVYRVGERDEIQCNVRDITERKRAEGELRFRNLILRTQQEASLDGILVVDVDGRIVSSNLRFSEMWGIAGDAVATRSDQQILGSIGRMLADPESFIEGVKHLHDHPDEKSQDELSLNDGRTFERYSAPMLGADGTYFGRVWYFRDISARKAAEAERATLADQLRAAQKMEAIGVLAGGVAHDFNNLLSVILSYTDFVRDGSTDSAGDLMEVKKAALRAADLTRQLLAFSRKQVLQPVPLDLNQIAAGLERMLRRILGEDIDFVEILAPDLGLVRADPGQIEQVIMNLVVNARDAMPQGGKLSIETSNVEIDAERAAQAAVEPGPYAQLSVIDTGCGMDAPTQSQVFEPFFTTKETGKGTGLGLSTAFGIVSQSGGSISVASEHGHGATFKVLLPRDRSGSLAAPIDTPRASRRSGRGETVLVVEDEAPLRAVVKRTLEAGGYTVLTAANGVEALAVAAGHPGTIHLLLTDVVMPRMSGRVLAEALTRARPALEVLYMSGYTNDAILHHGVLDAETPFLGKPFTGADLTQKVREVLDGGAARLEAHPN